MRGCDYLCYNLSWTDKQKPENFLLPKEKEELQELIPIEVSPYMVLLNNNVGKRILSLFYREHVEEDEFYQIIVEKEKLISKEVLKGLIEKLVSGGVIYKCRYGYGDSDEIFFTNTEDGNRLHKFFNNQLRDATRIVGNHLEKFNQLEEVK